MKKKQTNDSEDEDTETEKEQKPWGRRVVINTPFSPLTFNELHAGILGNIGLLCGIGGYPTLAVGLGVGAILFAEEVGLSVITKEPWYFIGLLVITYLIGAGVANLGVL